MLGSRIPAYFAHEFHQRRTRTSRCHRSQNPFISMFEQDGVIKQRTPKMMVHPGQQEDRQRVIARLPGG
jgi:hypothetical protein